MQHVTKITWKSEHYLFSNGTVDSEDGISTPAAPWFLAANVISDGKITGIKGEQPGYHWAIVHPVEDGYPLVIKHSY